MRKSIGNIALAITGLLAATAPATAATPAARKPGYRIYISVDMEGIAGAVTPVQLMPAGNEYAAYRKVMVGEVLAAIAGAKAAGATQFVVSDSHGNMQNIPLDDLPEDVTLIRGTERPLEMMEGIDHGKYDGAIFIGYHASASSVGGVRAHTMFSARLSEVKLNGVPASEGLINAAIAGQFGVPVLLVTGDDVAVKELAPLNAEGVAVKRAISFHSAETLTPAAARKAIEEGAKRAVSGIASHKPFTVASPTSLDVTFHYYRPAELLSWLPSFERIGARSVRITAPDPATAMKRLTFATAYSIELEP